MVLAKQFRIVERVRFEPNTSVGSANFGKTMGALATVPAADASLINREITETVLLQSLDLRFRT